MAKANNNLLFHTIKNITQTTENTMPHKIFFCFLLLISLTFGANDDAREIGKAVSDIEHLQKNYEKLDGKIDEMEKNQKSVEEYKNAIADQNSRIQDLSFYNSWLAIIVGIWTLATTILLVFLAFKWKKEATTEAVEAAREAAKTWLQENVDKKIADKLKEFDDDVKSKISDADIVIDKKMKEIEEDIKQRIDAIYEEHKKVMELFEEVKKANGDIKRLDEVQADKSTIDEALRQAEARAKSTNKYTDWFEAATLAYKQNNYAKAIIFLDNAIATTKNDISKATCLINKGVTLGQQGDNKEAIKTYDKLYEEFNTSQNEEIMVLVAMALYNKGVALGQQGDDKEEIKIYDKLYEEFNASQNKEIMAQVAKALYNKGVRLAEQGDNKEAEEQYLKSIEFNPSYLAAYINIFGLWLVTGDEFDEKIVSQFLENARDDKQALFSYEMIVTLKASLLSNQSAKIKELKDKYSGIGFGGWEWKGLEVWARDMADGAAGARVLEAISEFKPQPDWKQYDY